jgi:hypothetical protein
MSDTEVDFSESHESILSATPSVGSSVTGSEIMGGTSDADLPTPRRPKRKTDAKLPARRKVSLRKRSIAGIIF